jgi:outer membrane lipoprotein carrier protein
VQRFNTFTRLSDSLQRSLFVRRPHLPLVFLLISSAVAVSAQTRTIPTDPVLAHFEARYRAAHTLSATFLEEYSENGQATRKEAGTAYFLRPGKMRWDYEAPEKNLFLVDGKYAWFYAPADRTASRTPAKTTQDWRTPLALLTTDMKLSRICSEIGVSRTEKSVDAQNQVYRCALRSSEPKTADAKSPDPKSPKAANPPPSQEAYFEVSPDGELARIIVRDPGGIRIEFRFRNWQWDPSLDKSLFQFKPPMGVAIINGMLPEASPARQ